MTRTARPVYERASTHYSGVLVLARAPDVDACTRNLEGLTGVEVHHVHRDSGRIVVVHESGSLREQERRLLEIRALPEVILAELVYHYVDSDSTSAATESAAGTQEHGR